MITGGQAQAEQDRTRSYQVKLCISWALISRHQI